jgi:hypothetical protein
MHNFWVFIGAVADNWIFWVGLFLMIEPYLEGAAPKTFKIWRELSHLYPAARRKVFRIVGVIALLTAIFQTWNAEYEGRLAAESNQVLEPLDKRLAMKNLISTAISEGEALGKDWFKKEDQPFLHDTNVWTNKTGNMVEDAYGKGELSLWMSDAGFTNHADGKKHTDLHNWIVNRLTRLNELMKRVDSIRMVPSFDPKNYHWVEKCDGC